MFKHNLDGGNGTSLEGYVVTDYATLVKIFGEPTHNGDGYKIDAEWVLKRSDNGECVTIYNYKDGKNYNGECGLDVEDITNWHIGSSICGSSDNVQWVLDMISGKDIR